MYQTWWRGACTRSDNVARTAGHHLVIVTAWLDPELRVGLSLFERDTARFFTCDSICKEMIVKFFNFESFISTTIIKLVFVLGVILGVIGWLASTGLAAVQQGATQAVAAFVVGAIGLVLGLLLWRVYCEIAIVMFRIYEEIEGLRDVMEDSTAQQQGGPTGGGQPQQPRSQQGGQRPR